MDNKANVHLIFTQFGDEILHNIGAMFLEICAQYILGGAAMYTVMAWAAEADDVCSDIVPAMRTK